VSDFYQSAQNRFSSRSLSKNINMKVRIYTTISLPVVLYGFETWPLTLWGKHRLGVFENSVLKKISRLKRNNVTGRRRRLCNENLYGLYSLPTITPGVKSRIRYAGHVGSMGEQGRCIQCLGGEN
jgi:hypothetical protein